MYRSSPSAPVCWALFFCIALISGCASDLSVYTITESELNSYVRDELKRLDRQQLNAGSPLSIQLRQSSVRIGPENREVVQLDLAGELALHAFVAKIPLDVRLKLEGVPVFEPEERALYIRRLDLLESEIESELLQGRLGTRELEPAAALLVGSLAKILERQPVYRFDSGSFTGRLLQFGDMRLKVASGKLLLVPGEE